MSAPDHTAAEVWAFDPNRPPESLAQAVQEAVGGASMCWEHVELAGVFQSDRALEVSSALIRWVDANYKPKVRQHGTVEQLVADSERDFDGTPGVVVAPDGAQHEGVLPASAAVPRVGGRTLLFLSGPDRVFEVIGLETVNGGQGDDPAVLRLRPV